MGKIPVAQPVSMLAKKTKRKASVPEAPRLKAQSVTNNLTHDTSMGDLSTMAPQTTNNVSVMKGRDSGTISKSSYPSYFFTPKENAFEAKRGSRYDKG